MDPSSDLGSTIHSIYQLYFNTAQSHLDPMTSIICRDLSTLSYTSI